MFSLKQEHASRIFQKRVTHKMIRLLEETEITMKCFLIFCSPCDGIFKSNLFYILYQLQIFTVFFRRLLFSL